MPQLSDSAASQAAAVRRSSGRSMSDGAFGPQGGWCLRGAILAFLHLTVLSAFAVARPFLEPLARSPELFTARGAGATEVVLTALAVLLLPPALLLALALLAGLVDERLRRGLGLTFLGGLVALLALALLRRLFPGGSLELVPVAVAVAVGATGALAYARVGAVRSLLTVLAPAPLVFIALFLLVSPVSGIVLGHAPEARASVGAQAPVVMIVFDELPLTSLLDARGELDAAHYPNFAALARSSTWFRNATGVHDRSAKAVPALLTGRQARPGELPIAADHPRNLFTLLRGSHRMTVFEEATGLCPDDLCRPRGGGDRTKRGPRSLPAELAAVLARHAVPARWRSVLPSVSEPEGFAGEEEAADEPRSQKGSGNRRDSRRGRTVPELRSNITKDLRSGRRSSRFDGFVASLGKDDSVLYFEHALFPHTPFHHLPSGTRYEGDPEGTIEGLVPPSGTEPLRDRFAAAQGYQRHLLQLAFTDRLLGRVLDRLRNLDVFDRALIVVTADHGATFQPGEDRRAVTERTFADVASVPLLVKAPRQRGGEVSDAYVQSTDLLPTMADLLGTRLPWRVDGRSALAPGAGRRDSVTMVQGAERRTRISRGIDDRPVSLSVRDLEMQEAAALGRKRALFGPTLDPFALGPYRELHGRLLTGLPVAPGPAPARARLDAPDALRAVDPASGVVPAHLTGRVQSGETRKRALGLAVNGRLVATAESFFVRDSGVERLSIVIPEAALRPGANAVEVFQIDRGGGGGPVLRSLGRFGGR